MPIWALSKLDPQNSFGEASASKGSIPCTCNNNAFDEAAISIELETGFSVRAIP